MEKQCTSCRQAFPVSELCTLQVCVGGMLLIPERHAKAGLKKPGGRCRNPFGMQGPSLVEARGLAIERLLFPT